MSTHGWQKVFKFTFMQQLKSKAFIISSVLICTLIFAMMILLGLLPTFSDEGDSTGGATGDITVNKVYLIDDSGITNGEDYKTAFDEMKIELITSTDKATTDTYSDAVKNGTACLLLTLTKEEEYISIYAGRPADNSVSSDEARTIATLTESVFNYARLEKYGLHPHIKGYNHSGRGSGQPYSRGYKVDSTYAFFSYTLCTDNSIWTACSPVYCP